MRTETTKDLSPAHVATALMAGRRLSASAVASGTTVCTEGVRLPVNLSPDADATLTGPMSASWPTYVETAKPRADVIKPGFVTVIDHRLSRRPLERAP